MSAQIMRVGNGVLVAVEAKVSHEAGQSFQRQWAEKFPDVPLALLGDSTIVQRDAESIDVMLIDQDPKAVEAFKEWWSKISR